MTTVMAYIQPQTRTGSMSELGQSRHFRRRPTTSGLPPETDTVTAGRHVSKVPRADQGPAPKLLRIARERDKPVPVRHSHLGQRLRIDHIVQPDDPVEIEDIGRYRVDFVRGERFRLLEWHCATDIVEQCCCIGPETSHSLYRYFVRCQCAHAADQRASERDIGPGSLLAVTSLAFRYIDGFTLDCGATTRRQTYAIRSDADVPRCDVGGRYRLPELRGLGQGRRCVRQHRYADCNAFKRKHCWPPPSRQCASLRWRCSDRPHASRARQRTARALAAPCLCRQWRDSATRQDRRSIATLRGSAQAPLAGSGPAKPPAPNFVRRQPTLRPAGCCRCRTRPGRKFRRTRVPSARVPARGAR